MQATQFEYVPRGGSEARQITATITPVLIGSEWFAIIEVHGLEQPYTHQVSGVNPMHAMNLATKLVHDLVLLRADGTLRVVE